MSTYQYVDKISMLNTKPTQAAFNIKPIQEAKNKDNEINEINEVDQVNQVNEVDQVDEELEQKSNNSENSENEEYSKQNEMTKIPTNPNRGGNHNNNLNRGGHNNNRNSLNYSRTCIYICAFAIIAIVIIATVSASFHTIPYYQLGFVKDKYGVVDVDTIMGSGLRFLTLDKELVLFPSTFQNVMFSKKDFTQLIVYSDTGLSFEVEASFEYQLMKDNLKYMYTQYGKKYDLQVRNIAKAVIKERATHYLPDQYVSMRKIIEDDFALSIQKKVLDSVGIHVPITHFILLNIIFPRKLIDKSLESVVEIQITQINLNQQAVNMTIADTNVLLAQINSVTNAINSMADIQAKEIIANSESLMNSMISSARAKGINNTLNYLNITNPIYIKKFMDIVSLMESDNYSLFFGQMNPLVQITK